MLYNYHALVCFNLKGNASSLILCQNYLVIFANFSLQYFRVNLSGAIRNLEGLDWNHNEFID